jgi:formylglycine-generating enzyme required for sulfatase activity
MKPTTTSVFASPVRPHFCRSRVVYGQRERAAGAQPPCFLPAQDGQAKSSPGRWRGSRLFIACCRVFLMLSLLILSGSIFAGEQAAAKVSKNPSPTSQPTVTLAGQSTSQANTSGVLAESADVPASPAVVFTAEQIETLRLSCREPNGDLGPAMVVIKPGNFLMGSDDTDGQSDSDETPRHDVTIPRPFAVSRCEITVGQFRQFVAETNYQTTAQRPTRQDQAASDKQTGQQKTENQGCNVWNIEKKSAEYQTERYWDNPGFNQTDQHPVVCVSYDDATAYVEWLSQRTGGQYRLLTEAEWEYMARAETETPRYFGQQAQCKFANAADQSAKAMNFPWSLADCNDGFAYTAPVAQFQPNAFGLFDVLGNVWEWTDDCWHSNYSKEQKDGSQAWLEVDQGDCGRRVVRGGSWNDGPGDLRSADRNGSSTDEADGILGFRIARAL